MALVIHKELSTQSAVDYRLHAPDVLELLQQSINELWKKDRDIVQVARWLRTTYSVTIGCGHNLDNDRVVLKLLDQAATLANRGAQGDTTRYPEDELQWLATSSYNRGVDFFVAGKHELGWKHFDAALELAKYAVDSGALHACLTAKRAEINERTQRQV